MPRLSVSDVITRSDYPALFDTDNDTIPDVDDPEPDVPNKPDDSIEEVRLSSEIGKLIDLRATLEKDRVALQADLERLAPGAVVHGRTKTPYSIINKLIRKRLTGPRAITDLVGAMVVVDSYDQAAKMAKKIRAGTIGPLLEEDDHYTHPVAGYRAFHFIIERNGFPMEVQVRTMRAYKLASASHEPYKAGRLNAELYERLGALAERADKGDARAIEQIDSFLNEPEEVIQDALTVGHRQLNLNPRPAARPHRLSEYIDVVQRGNPEKTRFDAHTRAYRNGEVSQEDMAFEVAEEMSGMDTGEDHTPSRAAVEVLGGEIGIRLVLGPTTFRFSRNLVSFSWAPVDWTRGNAVSMDVHGDVADVVFYAKNGEAKKVGEYLNVRILDLPRIFKRQVNKDLPGRMHTNPLARYRSLLEVPKVTGDNRFGRGRLQVWYARPGSVVPRVIHGLDELRRTHVYLGPFNGVSRSDVFEAFQERVWSPNGEADYLVSQLGTDHVGMTIGDVVVDQHGTAWELRAHDWRPFRSA